MKKLSIPFLLFILSCSENQPIEGATWKGTSDFMFITDKSMQMHYASSILSKEVTSTEGSPSIVAFNIFSISNAVNFIGCKISKFREIHC